MKEIMMGAVKDNAWSWSIDPCIEDKLGLCVQTAYT